MLADVSALVTHTHTHTGRHHRGNTCHRLKVGMNALDEVPFQTLLGPLEDELRLVTTPPITVPDSRQILRDTEYRFDLEKLVSGQQPQCQAPSCPPFWLMFSSPQQGRRSGCSCVDVWAPRPRCRSHSLSSADAPRLRYRTITFHISDSEDDGEEGNNVSSTEDTPLPVPERPRSAAPAKHPLTRVQALQSGSCAPPSQAASPPSLQATRPPMSPLLLGRKGSKKRQCSAGCQSKRFSQNSPSAAFSPRRLQQQRPSSAGPAVKNRKQALTSGRSCGLFFDSATELLSALSQEERELLENITARGFPLRTAILALQKTGYHSPDKILKYLRSRDRLCELGFDEAQVDEALEMFQNCESKAAEFLRLLAQFNEMGFQQSTIKEVLLVHENHRERALEELMTRMA